jgi:hypothetical protein
MSDTAQTSGADDWTPVAYEDEALEPKPREKRQAKREEADDAVPSGGLQMPMAFMLPSQILERVDRLIARIEGACARLEEGMAAVEEGMAVIADALEQIKPKETADDA